MSAISKRTGGLAISYAIDSASEDEADISGTTTMMPTPDSGVENIAPGKKRVGRPKATANSSAIKAPAKAPVRASARRISGGAITGNTKARAGRKPLTEILNPQDTSDTEEVDDFEILAEPKAKAPLQMNTPVTAMKPPAKKRGPAKGKANETKQKGAKGNPAVAPTSDMGEIPETQEDVVVQSKLARTQSAAAKKPRVAKREVVPETQPERMDIDKSEAQPDAEDPIDDPTPRPISRAANRAISAPRQRQASVPHRRGGSASDTERGGNDPTLRRQLNDLTKKFEALDSRYRSIRDVGVQEAGVNFEKLKFQADEKTQAAKDLIASLRSDLADKTTVTDEVNSLRTQINTLTTQNDHLCSEKKTLQSSLNETQKEIKALNAKLTTAKATQSSETSNTKVPGSAAKSTSQKPRVIHIGSTEAVKEAQQRIMKEELYGDLTGLILRDIKRNEEEGEDVYDCIQTGRNGTLHFKLSLATQPAPTTTNNPNSKSQFHAPHPPVPFEEQEFQYTPQLDQNRDRDLIEILPDYLTEDICFPRANAAKFYARVSECMTKRIEIVEEEEGEDGEGE